MKAVIRTLVLLGLVCLAGCATVDLSPIERESIRRAAVRVLPADADVVVETHARFLSKPDVVISAHLLEGHSADETSPYVQGDYGTHERLTRLVRLRSAKVVKAVLTKADITKVGGVVVKTNHGVRQSYVGSATPVMDVSMTLYTIRFGLEGFGVTLSELGDEEIMSRFEVIENTIPSLSFEATSD